MLVQVVAEVAGQTAQVRDEWPAKVLLIGWAAYPRDCQGENPINIVNDVDVGCVYHNLVQLQPKDPAVELFLGWLFKVL